MSNVLVEQLSGTSGDVFRESTTDGPAYESQNARLEQVGVFRDDEPPPSQAATAMVYQAATGDEDAPIEFVAGRAGTIIGIVAAGVRDDSTATIGVGSVTVNATVGGAKVGDDCVLNLAAPKAKVTFSTPVAFNSLDELGMSCKTSADMTSTSNFYGWLLIRWAPDAV